MRHRCRISRFYPAICARLLAQLTTHEVLVRLAGLYLPSNLSSFSLPVSYLQIHQVALLGPGLRPRVFGSAPFMLIAEPMLVHFRAAFQRKSRRRSLKAPFGAFARLY